MEIDARGLVNQVALLKKKKCTRSQDTNPVARSGKNSPLGSRSLLGMQGEQRMRKGGRCRGYQRRRHDRASGISPSGQADISRVPGEVCKHLEPYKGAKYIRLG